MESIVDRMNKEQRDSVREYFKQAEEILQEERPRQRPPQKTSLNRLSVFGGNMRLSQPMFRLFGLLLQGRETIAQLYAAAVSIRARAHPGHGSGRFSRFLGFCLDLI